MYVLIHIHLRPVSGPSAAAVAAAAARQKKMISVGYTRKMFSYKQQRNCGGAAHLQRKRRHLRHHRRQGVDRRSSVLLLHLLPRLHLHHPCHYKPSLAVHLKEQQNTGDTCAVHRLVLHHRSQRLRSYCIWNVVKVVGTRIWNEAKVLACDKSYTQQLCFSVLAYIYVQ